MTTYGCVNGEPSAKVTDFGLIPSDITTGTYIFLDDCCKYGDDGNYDIIALLTTFSGMEPYTTQEVTISGGCPPYLWNAEAPFSFTSYSTTTTSNTLYLNSDTPQNAVSDITITDVCYSQSSPASLPIAAQAGIAKDGSGDPWAVIFIVNTSDCFHDDAINTISLQPSYTITQVSTSNVGITVGGLNPVTLTVPADYTTTISLSITMKADGYEWADGSDVYGTAVMSVPYCNCVEDPLMAWDDGTSATTIAQSSEATVAVTGVNAPFTWSVSGSGFSMKYSRTIGLTNTLESNGSACGTATITATGCDGEEVIGELTCTVGGWVWLGDNEEGYCYDVPDRLSHYTFERISGAWRATGKEYCSGTGASTNSCCGFCQDLFNICTYCAGFDPDRIANVEIFCYKWGCS